MTQNDIVYIWHGSFNNETPSQGHKVSLMINTELTRLVLCCYSAHLQVVSSQDEPAQLGVKSDMSEVDPLGILPECFLPPTGA